MAGAPYRGRLLPLPAFLRHEEFARGASNDELQRKNPPPCDIRDGFRLTEFFLNRDVFAPRGQRLPEARSAYLAELAKRADWTT